MLDPRVVLVCCVRPGDATAAVDREGGAKEYGEGCAGRREPGDRRRVSLIVASKEIESPKPTKENQVTTKSLKSVIDLVLV